MQPFLLSMMNCKFIFSCYRKSLEFGNFDSTFPISLFRRRDLAYRVMSVGEGSYHKCLESKYQDPFHQIPADSVKFISSPSQSLTAPPSHYVQSPEQQGIPINYQSHNYNHHSRFNCHPNSGGNFSFSENDSAVQLSADYSNPNPLNDLDFQLMNIDQNMSPSSGITSVCFLPFLFPLFLFF